MLFVTLQLQRKVRRARSKNNRSARSKNRRSAPLRSLVRRSARKCPL